MLVDMHHTPPVSKRESGSNVDIRQALLLSQRTLGNLLHKPRELVFLLPVPRLPNPSTATQIIPLSAQAIDIIKQGLRKTRLTFPPNSPDFSAYLVKHPCPEYFSNRTWERGGHR
jgi:hypothetical protein